MTRLSSARWPSGYERVVLGRVGSTNAEALRRAGDPSFPAPCWFLAAEQTAGRGRRARAWHSPPGNFHATLLLRPDGPSAELAQRSFAAALAVRGALEGALGVGFSGAQCTLKWPNDVLLNGGKVAGILLESQLCGAKSAALAIGIGVNLIACPEAGQLEPHALRAVCLASESQVTITPAEFLPLLAAAYAHWEARLTQEGFAPLRAAWLSHAAHLGSPIFARTGKEVMQGLFETIDAQGNLVLRRPSGCIAIPAAEVFFDDGEGGADAAGY